MCHPGFSLGSIRVGAENPMNVKAYLTDDDRGVSPVIGVILMVAITVILAAVIASFVIGLGDQNQETAPTTSVEFSYDEGDDELEISVTGGENLDPTNVEIQGDTDPSSSYSGSDSPNATDKDWDSYSTTSGPTTELQAGSKLTLEVAGDYDISVVYVNPNTEESFTLGSDSGPDA